MIRNFDDETGKANLFSFLIFESSNLGFVDYSTLILISKITFNLKLLFIVVNPAIGVY